MNVTGIMEIVVRYVIISRVVIIVLVKQDIGYQMMIR